MWEGDERTADAAFTVATMRCFHIFTIRRHRRHCALLLGLPLIVVILFKTGTLIHQKEIVGLRKYLGHEADDDGEVAVMAKEGRFEPVDLTGHFNPPRGDWRKWKESKVSGVKIQTWTAKRTRRVEDEVVYARHGEQILSDDVVPEAFHPFVVPSTARMDKPRRKMEPKWIHKGLNGKSPANDVRQQNRKVVWNSQNSPRRNQLEGDQGGFANRSRGRQKSMKISDSKKISNKNNLNMLGGEGKLESESDSNGHAVNQGGVAKQLDAVVSRGREDHKPIKRTSVKVITPKSQNVALKSKTSNKDGASIDNALMENAGVFDMNADDVRAVQKMHTPPPWTRTLKPLRYEDYAAYCSQGSLPLPGSSFHTKSFCMVDDHREHFGMVGSQLCYHKGTDVGKTTRMKSAEYCICKMGWHGKFCSMHDIVFNGGYPYEYGVGIQKPPRRLIYAFPFNAEFDMLDIILNSLSDAVDVFLILESNYTAAGQPKDRVLLQRLQNGYFKRFQQKIVYISLDYFPRAAYADGWVADALLRNYIGETAFGGILENVRDDDIIVSLDADEVILPEAIMFLKLHYGYPEPFGFTFHHTVYGYFWRAPDEITNAYGGCRVAMFRELLKGHLYDVRNAPKNIRLDAGRLKRYKRRHGTRIKPWLFGSRDHPAGWHCSWCFPPLGIRYKLISAHASDFPRWGTFPDNTKVGFIAKLVEKGIWFDEKTSLKRQLPGADNFAPPYVKAQPERFVMLREYEAYVKNSQKLADDAQQVKLKAGDMNVRKVI